MPTIAKVLLGLAAAKALYKALHDNRGRIGSRLMNDMPRRPRRR